MDICAFCQLPPGDAKTRSKGFFETVLEASKSVGQKGKNKKKKQAPEFTSFMYHFKCFPFAKIKTKGVGEKCPVTGKVIILVKKLNKDFETVQEFDKFPEKKIDNNDSKNDENYFETPASPKKNKKNKKKSKKTEVEDPVIEELLKTGSTPTVETFSPPESPQVNIPNQEPEVVESPKNQSPPPEPSKKEDESQQETLQVDEVMNMLKGKLWEISELAFQNYQLRSLHPNLEKLFDNCILPYHREMIQKTELPDLKPTPIVNSVKSPPPGLNQTTPEQPKDKQGMLVKEILHNSF